MNTPPVTEYLNRAVVDTVRQQRVRIRERTTPRYGSDRIAHEKRMAEFAKALDAASERAVYQWQTDVAKAQIAEAETDLAKAQADSRRATAKRQDALEKLNRQQAALLAEQADLERRLRVVQENVEKSQRQQERSNYQSAQVASYQQHVMAEELEVLARQTQDKDLRDAYFAQAREVRQWRGEREH